VGDVPVVVVAFTDMVISAGGCSGRLTVIGSKDAVTESMDTVGISMAGEFGL
jgi:hypothetical protein